MSLEANVVGLDLDVLHDDRFVFDTRDQAQLERLRLIDTSKGPWKCHTIFNCNEACPKDIDITNAIARLKLKLSQI